MPRAAVEHMQRTVANIRIIDIHALPDAPQVPMSGYQIKCFAILLSSFAEVLFLDADNVRGRTDRMHVPRCRCR